jgi:23S rRNA (guanosine2251-2'-O)-methyltransferase
MPGQPLPVAVVLDNVRSMYNAGAFFRTCDAAGAEKLVLCGITAHPPQPGVAKTALGAERSVAWFYEVDTLVALRLFRARGYQLAAVETAQPSVDLFEWQPRWPVCVVFGNEVDGLSGAVLDACDVRVRIPMQGAKSSLNVATAGGIVLYELLRKWSAARGVDPRG